MSLTVIQVPYDSGHYARRMGRGPGHLIERGLVAALEEAGHGVRVQEIRIEQAFPSEVGVALETQRRAADCVAAEIGEGRFPLVLSGNCATCVGSVAAVGSRSTGVIWLDSHGDFNTPETSASGFFDGMVLAMLTGGCWSTAAAGVRGFEPVPERNVVLVGARDFDPAEEERLRRSELTRIGVDSIRLEGAEAALAGHLDALSRRVDACYLHLDLDVLDPAVGRVNPFQAAAGLTVEDVLEIIEAAAARMPLAVAALTAFDPDGDVDGAVTGAAIRLAVALAGCAARSTG